MNLLVWYCSHRQGEIDFRMLFIKPTVSLLFCMAMASSLDKGSCTARVSLEALLGTSPRDLLGVSSSGAPNGTESNEAFQVPGAGQS
jgi:hypothetical protein